MTDQKLMALQKYRATRFAKGSAPTEKTLRGWIRDGHLPGRLIGGKLYVDIAAEAKLATGNALADEILDRMGA